MYEPQPPGQLPREVYLRRRVGAAVIAVLVVIVVALALYLASRGDGTDTKEAAQSSQVQDSGASPSPSTGASASPTSSAVPAASRGRCEDNDLALSVWPANPNFPVGQQMRFFVQITNNSASTCDRDLAGAPLAFDVYRLDDNGKVWSSIDCTTPTGEDKLVLEPKKPAFRQVDWSGRVSAPGQCTDSVRSPAGIGFYQVYALVGKVFSPAATFNIVKG